MIINVTQADIDKGGNPIVNAVKREYDEDCTVDRKFIILDGGFPRRLSANAEAIMINFHKGEGLVVPFSFEVHK